MDIENGALLSPCRKYRYALWRGWKCKCPYVLFVGLNPSTADEHEDDPTIRRCRRFAADWGFDAFVMVNLFALRATDPADMRKASNPVGEQNDECIAAIATSAGLIVCAWGAHGKHLGQDVHISGLLQSYKLKCLGTTHAGQPRHPLYIRADKALENFAV